MAIISKQTIDWSHMRSQGPRSDIATVVLVGFGGSRVFTSFRVGGFWGVPRENFERSGGQMGYF